MAAERDPRALLPPEAPTAPAGRARGGLRGLPPVTFGTVLRLAIWSLVVGAALAFLDLTPREVLDWLTGSVRGFVDTFERSIGRFVSYLLLGAVIVVPIWVVFYLLRAFRR